MSDKRKVSTDALETLGTIHTKHEKRDAIHLAVEPVEAGEKLRPGDHITVISGVAYECEREKALGIVDPFLSGHVKKGERFWFVMYPRMVHSLRHVWTHPAFKDEPEAPELETKVVSAGDGITVKSVRFPVVSPPSVQDAAKQWIKNHADEVGLSYDKLMEAADTWLEGNWEYYVEYGGQSMQDTFDSEGFWPRYEIVTGKTIPEDLRQSFFSCSC